MAFRPSVHGGRHTWPPCWPERAWTPGYWMSLFPGGCVVRGSAGPYAGAVALGILTHNDPALGSGAKSSGHAKKTACGPEAHRHAKPLKFPTTQSLPIHPEKSGGPGEQVSCNGHVDSFASGLLPTNARGGDLPRTCPDTAATNRIPCLSMSGLRML